MHQFDPPALGGGGRVVPRGSCGPVDFGGHQLNDIATLAESSRKVKQFLTRGPFVGCGRSAGLALSGLDCTINSDWSAFRGNVAGATHYQWSLALFGQMVW